ncbi:hypothetical protein, partial [Klebsiella pneumoniae]
AMTRSRDAVLTIYSGAESPDPQIPSIPVSQVAVAYILLDVTQVVAITMADSNKVTSTENLGQRMNAVEAFDAQIGPRVSSLASDLAALANRVGQGTPKSAFAKVFEDIARVKALLRFPNVASDYGADFFLSQNLSDVNNTAMLGYDAKVEEGIRFPDANATQFEIGLFSNNDPNAALAGGILLPKYDDIVKIKTGDNTTDLGMAQYGFQTTTMQQGYMSRMRLRYGGSLDVCSNGTNWNTPGQPTDLTGLYDVTSSEFTAISSIWYDPNNWAHEVYRSNTYWLDQWKEPFMYAVTQNHVINGALVSQSFLVSNDMWMTKLGFVITSKGGTEDIHVALCEVTNGVPDPDKTVMKTVLPQANIVIGWNRISIPPTFAAKGKRFAVVLISNANHKIGMTDGQGYLDGTFFYSTDGAYYQGDLTKDMALEVWGAKFRAPQVTIEFGVINLDGGFRNIDILAQMWVPDSTQLVFEVRPSGTGDWQPLTPDNAGALGTAPALAQFRARFVGTSDMQAALTLTGSRVKVSRPKVAAKHVSTVITLATPSKEIHVTTTLEAFDEIPHDHGLTLRIGATDQVPSATTTKLLDAAAKRYEREYVFNLAATITQFRIVQTMATTSSQMTYHVADRTYYSI